MSLALNDIAESLLILSGADTEIFSSYGPHSNDLLLVECMSHCMTILKILLLTKETDGFVLDQNQWDFIALDDVVEHFISSPENKERLEKAGYLGYVNVCFCHCTQALILSVHRNYTLNRAGVCHRTQVAVRNEVFRESQCESFIAGTLIETKQDESEVNAFISMCILQPVLEKVETVLQALEERFKVTSEPWKVIHHRWTQIREMVLQALCENS